MIMNRKALGGREKKKPREEGQAPLFPGYFWVSAGSGDGRGRIPAPRNGAAASKGSSNWNLSSTIHQTRAGDFDKH